MLNSLGVCPPWGRLRTAAQVTTTTLLVTTPVALLPLLATSGGEESFARDVAEVARQLQPGRAGQSNMPSPPSLLSHSRRTSRSP